MSSIYSGNSEVRSDNEYVQGELLDETLYRIITTLDRILPETVLFIMKLTIQRSIFSKTVLFNCYHFVYYFLGVSSKKNIYCIQ